MAGHETARTVQTRKLHLMVSALGITLTVGAPLFGALAQSTPRDVGKGSHRHAPRAMRRVPHAVSGEDGSDAGEAITVNSARRAFSFSKAQHEADSVTHISADTLVNRGVFDVKGLQRVAPNVTIQSMNGTGTTNFFIRGIGFNDFTQNNMSSVMTYIDDVAFPLSTMMSGQMFDLSNVDVTPGPVGFTHGMADTGGEVSLHTNDPTPDWHGGVTEDIASYARSRTDLFISGPIARNLSFRIAGQTVHGGGWQYDPQNHTHLGNANDGALRAKIKWTPDAHTTIKLTGHWMQDDDQVVTGRPVLGFVASQPIPQLGYQQAEWSLRPQFAQKIGRSASLMPSEHNTLWGADLNMSHDFGKVTLSAISAYETERVGEFTDQDATALSTGDTYRNIVANVFSQEVRLHNSSASDRLQWDVGAFYNRTRMLQNYYFDFTDYLPQRGYLSETAFRSTQQSISEYGHISYRLPYNVTLFGGLNHTLDQRALIGLSTVHFGINDKQFNNESTLSAQVSGVLGVQWQATKGTLLYFKTSKGFKPGGFTANNTVSQAQLAPFEPETVLAFEAGFKSDLIPNRLRLNAAAFYDDYHGQQVVGTFLVPNYGPLSQIVNAPKSEIWGFETTIEAHPLPHVFLTQNLGWERGTYQVFNNIDRGKTNAYFAKTGIWQGFYDSFAGVDSGIPKLTLNGEADYRSDVFTRYNVEGGVDWMYRDSQAITPGGVGVYRLPTYFLLGAHLTFRPKNGPWSVTAYASNILNRQYAETAGNASTTYFYIPGPPRFIGGRMSLTY